MQTERRGICGIQRGGVCGHIHPHACGADSSAIYRAKAACRFIPTRVGRTIQLVLDIFCNCRFIPTRVGRTAISYPVKYLDCGSSPRVWGGRLKSVQGRMSRRFIPTRVGRTQIYDMWKKAESVHPHACGADTGKSAVIASFSVQKHGVSVNDGCGIIQVDSGYFPEVQIYYTVKI